MMARMAALVLAMAMMSAIAAPASADQRAKILAIDPVIHAAPKGLPTTAAYATLKNQSKRAQRLLAVSCDCAADVTVHETRTEGGVTRMALADLIIPAGGEVTLKPGGLHIMLMGLKQPIAAGETVRIRLAFDHAPSTVVRFKAVK